MSHATPLTQNRPRLDVALEAAAHGYLVFPTNPKSKTPYGQTHGHLDATDDPVELRAAWAMWPDALPSIAPHDGVVVLDFDTDPRKGLDAATVQAKLGWDLPETFTDRTRRGGWHYWYRTPPGTNPGSRAPLFRDTVGPGLDQKAQGGYVCIHGDVVPPHRSELTMLPPVYAQQLALYQGRGKLAKLRPVSDFLDVVTTDEGFEQLEQIELKLWAVQKGGGRDNALYQQSIELGEWVARRKLNPLEAQQLIRDVDARWRAEGSDSHLDSASNGFAKGISNDVGISIDGFVAKHQAERKAAKTQAQDAPSAAALYERAKAAEKEARLRGTPDEIEAAAGATVAARALHKAASKELERAARIAARAPANPEELLRNNDGSPSQCVENVLRVLAMPQYAGMQPWWDDFKGITMLGEAQLTPADELEICCMLSANHQLHPNEGVIRRGITAAALTHRSHPIKERFEANPWEGAPHTDEMAMLLCGPSGDPAEDAYNARCIRQWGISAVKRIYEPGCKADSMLVLYAEAGGEGKTSALAALVGEGTNWYNPAPVSMDEKRTMMVMPYFWVHEVAEMPMRSNNEEYMNFIDRTHDSGVRMRGHAVENVPRQSVLWGTTNRRLFLVDRSSENRRFLVLEVRHGNIDIPKIRALHLQFWAELHAAYLAGEPGYPTPAEREEIGRRNQAYLADDSVEDSVADAFRSSTQTFWTSRALLEKAIASAPEARPNGTSVGLAATKCGWTKTNDGTKRGWAWKGSKKPHAVPPKIPAPITAVPAQSTPAPRRAFTPKVN